MNSVYELLQSEIEGKKWDKIRLVGSYNTIANRSGITNPNDYSFGNEDRSGEFTVKITKDKANVYVTVHDEQTINTLTNEPSFRSLVIASDFKINHKRVVLTRTKEDGSTETRDIDLTGYSVFPKPSMNEFSIAGYIATKSELTYLEGAVQNVRNQRNSIRKELLEVFEVGTNIPFPNFGKRIVCKKVAKISRNETTDRKLKEITENIHWGTIIEGNLPHVFVPRAFEVTARGLMEAEQWLELTEPRLTRLRHATRIWELGVFEHYPERESIEQDGVTISMVRTVKAVNEYPKGVRRTYAFTPKITKIIEIEDVVLPVVVQTTQDEDVVITADQDVFM